MNFLRNVYQHSILLFKNTLMKKGELYNMKRIYLETHEKDKKSRLLPNADDRDYLLKLFNKNPSGYKNKKDIFEDYFKMLDGLTNVFRQKLPENNNKEVFVGRIFEMNFWGIEQVEFVNKKHFLATAIKE